MRPCSVCNHPKRQEIEELIRKGKINLEDASKELDTSAQNLWHHLKAHKGRTGRSVKTLAERIKFLEELLEKLSDKFEPMLGDAWDYSIVRQLPPMIRELRGLVMDLSQLEGSLPQPDIYIQQVTVLATRLQEFLVSELCDECRKKYMKIAPTLKVPAQETSGGTTDSN